MEHIEQTALTSMKGHWPCPWSRILEVPLPNKAGMTPADDESPRSPGGVWAPEGLGAGPFMK